MSDVTNAWAVLALMGPHARDLMARLTTTPLDDASFPANDWRQISIGYATALASRRSYMGELGYEIFAPVEFAAMIYDALHAAGAAFGLRDAGYYAVDSLRIEKGFRAWGRELSPDVTPWEAGLGFAVKRGKGDFLGRDALLAARERPLSRRVVCLAGPRPGAATGGQMAWGGEALLADGAPAGEIASAAYGASLDGLTALALVRRADGPIDQAWLDARDWTVDLAGTRVPVRASLKPFAPPAAT